MSPVLILSFIVFMGVVTLVVAGFMFYREYAGSKTIEDRLGRLTGSNTPTLEAAGILREPMYPENAGSLMEQIVPKLPSLTRFFEQADFKMAPSQFWILSMVMGIVGVAVTAWLRLPSYSWAIGAIAFSFLPLGYVWFLRKRRLAKFGSQLCEALELVARALRAGHSLAAGMHVVAEEMPQPISKEFGRVWEEQNLGLSIEQAMRNIAERVPNLDLKFFVTAVVIQRQTGGDLSEILDKIGYIIRERFKILGMVKALTGEGRLSGVVLIGLPFALLLLLMQINPDYIALLWTTDVGKKMSMTGIVLMIIGAYSINKIIDIKV